MSDACASTEGGACACLPPQVEKFWAAGQALDLSDILIPDMAPSPSAGASDDDWSDDWVLDGGEDDDWGLGGDDDDWVLGEEEWGVGELLAAKGSDPLSQPAAAEPAAAEEEEEAFAISGDEWGATGLGEDEAGAAEDDEAENDAEEEEEEEEDADDFMASGSEWAASRKAAAPPPPPEKPAEEEDWSLGDPALKSMVEGLEDMLDEDDDEVDSLEALEGEAEGFVAGWGDEGKDAEGEGEGAEGDDAFEMALDDEGELKAGQDWDALEAQLIEKLGSEGKPL